MRIAYWIPKREELVDANYMICLTLSALVTRLDGVGVGGAADGVPALSHNPLSRLLGDLCVGDDLFRL